MKKQDWAALAVGAVTGTWCIRRDRKYPVRRELRFANKLAVPGCVLNGDTARLANRALAQMGFTPPQEIKRRGTQIPSEDGTMIRLTIYRPENLNGDSGMPEYAAPLLAHDFSDLPPTYVEVEEFDCLHDEGIAYAQALEAAGVEVHLEDVRGTFHGFDFFTGKEISKAMIQKRTRTLQQAFNPRVKRS